MKIAITGAAGFVGSYLVNKLSQAHDIIAMYHQTLPEIPINENIKLVKGSVEELFTLNEVFQTAEMVIHLVGIIAETKTKTFDKLVVQGTNNVVKACQKADINKIIYLSALRTSESSVTKYHQSKYLAEQSILTSGLEYIILRPSVIYGKNDGFVTMLTNLIKYLPFTPVIGTGKYLLQPIYIDDLIEIVDISLKSPKAWNRIINIAGPEQLEYVKILNIIKKVLRKKRMNFYIPLALMKVIASLLERILKPAPVTVDQLLMLENGNIGDIEMMLDLFSIEPLKFEDGLKIYLR